MPDPMLDRPPVGPAELGAAELSSLPAGGLSHGPSGTGKTLSAALIGKLMPEEPIWYIGETEKNIED